MTEEQTVSLPVYWCVLACLLCEKSFRDVLSLEYGKCAPDCRNRQGLHRGAARRQRPSVRTTDTRPLRVPHRSRLSRVDEPANQATVSEQHAYEYASSADFFGPCNGNADCCGCGGYLLLVEVVNLGGDSRLGRLPFDLFEGSIGGVSHQTLESDSFRELAADDDRSRLVGEFLIEVFKGNLDERERTFRAT
jgi:hypothetical protein